MYALAFVAGMVVGAAPVQVALLALGSLHAIFWASRATVKVLVGCPNNEVGGGVSIPRLECEPNGEDNGADGNQSECVDNDNVE